MKKILSIIICVWLISFTLVACCGSNAAEAKVEEYNRLSVIEDVSFSGIDGTYILVDDETGVCYLFVDGYESCAITVMLDADGKPLTYPGG